jgi:hypothetical protein
MHKSIQNTYVKPLSPIYIACSTIAVLVFISIEIRILHIGCGRVLRPLVHLDLVGHIGD